MSDVEKYVQIVDMIEEFHEMGLSAPEAWYDIHASLAGKVLGFDEFEKGQ